MYIYIYLLIYIYIYIYIHEVKFCYMLVGTEFVFVTRIRRKLGGACK
jgi:hypothetical protein